MEPVTALTDYLLAAAYLVLALRLSAKPHVSTRLASASLFATSLGAVAGGTHHLNGSQLLWTVTVYALGLAGFLMSAAAAFAAVSGLARKAVVVAAGLQFTVYAAWMARHDDFHYVVYQHGAALALTLALFCWASYRGRTAGAVWIGWAILVTAVASAVQTRGFALHRHFNHNDLYHVIQLGAAWLFYRAFREMTDASR
jgi:hypothetical protein